MLPLLAPTVFRGALLAAGPLPAPTHVATSTHAASATPEVQIYRLALRGIDATWHAAHCLPGRVGNHEITIAGEYTARHARG